MNNPVMFMDPWGLAPGDLIEDSLLELNSTQIDNIRDAEEAVEHGYISRLQFAKNVVLNGGAVERFPGVLVDECGDTITITAHVSINNVIDEETRYSVDDYEREIVNGIASEWSGRYGDKNIVTKIIMEENDNVYNTVRITLSSRNGASTGSMTENENNITLRLVSGAKLYTPKELGVIAAHEFGHAAFKIQDIYNMPEFKHNIVSLMNKPLVKGRREVDFALMSRHSLFKTTSIYTTESTESILNKYKNI